MHDQPGRRDFAASHAFTYGTPRRQLMHPSTSRVGGADHGTSAARSDGHRVDGGSPLINAEIPSEAPMLGPIVAEC